MSLDHLNNSKQSDSSDINQEESNNFQKYQINNMYDQEKHYNSHNIAGQTGLVTTQAIEFEKKKVQYRVANEIYIRQHPELSNMISIFLFRVLEEKPQDLLTYAGSFFDQPDLEKVIAIQKKHYLENGNATK